MRLLLAHNTTALGRASENAAALAPRVEDGVARVLADKLATVRARARVRVGREAEVSNTAVRRPVLLVSAVARGIRHNAALHLTSTEAARLRPVAEGTNQPAASIGVDGGAAVVACGHRPCEAVAPVLGILARDRLAGCGSRACESSGARRARVASHVVDAGGVAVAASGGRRKAVGSAARSVALVDILDNDGAGDTRRRVAGKISHVVVDAVCSHNADVDGSRNGNTRVNDAVKVVIGGCALLDIRGSGKPRDGLGESDRGGSGERDDGGGGVDARAEAIAGESGLARARVAANRVAAVGLRVARGIEGGVGAGALINVRHRNSNAG
eukprot:Opistho-2@34257